MRVQVQSLEDEGERTLVTGQLMDTDETVSFHVPRFTGDMMCKEIDAGHEVQADLPDETSGRPS